MARRKPTAIVASSLLAGACNPGASPPPVVGAVEPAAPDPAAEAASALAPDTLYHDDFARRTVYTWTTTDQIEELRRGRVLLSREDSPANGASYIDQVLHALAQRGDPLAALLYHAAFAKMRFAWHAPWATREGWPGEQYGEHLIRITLEPEAIVLALSTATGAFEARDLAGRPVTAAAVQARPERIGAIYFVSDAGQPPAPGVPAPKSTFREIVLCNEAMIASWSVGSDDAQRELAREASALEALARYVRTRPSPWDTPAEPPVRHAWRRPTPPIATPEHAFAAALALDSPTYRLDPDALVGLARRLRATPRPGAPIVGGGDATFAGLGAVRPPPRTINRSVGGSYAGSYARPQLAPAPQPAPAPTKRP